MEHNAAGVDRAWSMAATKASAYKAASKAASHTEKTAFALLTAANHINACEQASEDQQCAKSSNCRLLRCTIAEDDSK